MTTDELPIPSHTNQLTRLDAMPYEGVLTGAGILSAGVFQDTYIPMIHAGEIEYLAPPGGGPLPSGRVLILGLQNVHMQPAERSDVTLPAGIYDTIGFLDADRMRCRLEDSEFSDFWGFVCSCTGNRIYWEAFPNRSILCIDRGREPNPEAWFGPKPVFAQSISIARLAQ